MRPLGPLHVAAVVVGAVVGVGIFFTPATTANVLPTPAWAIGVWLIGGVFALSGAFVFSDLSARFPHAGGVYVFFRDGFGSRAGPPVAFLYGFLQLLVVQPGGLAIIALVLIDHVAFLTHPFSRAVSIGAAAASIAIFTAANLVGLRAGGRVQILMAALKVAALLSIIAIGLFFGHFAKLTAPRHTPVAGGLFAWLVLGFIPVHFTFGGATHGTFIAGSVRDPERSVPRGILLGIAIVLAGYLGVNVAYMALLGHDALAASASPAADAASVALGPAAGKIVAAVIIVSAAGILNTICLGFPFVIYAMARDGLFFRRAGELDARTQRPVFAVATQGLVACACVFVGHLEVLLKGVAFADASFQALAAIVALRFRPRSIAAWTFLVIESGVAIGCIVHTPRESSYGIALLAIGTVAYFVWRR